MTWPSRQHIICYTYYLFDNRRNSRRGRLWGSRLTPYSEIFYVTSPLLLRDFSAGLAVTPSFQRARWPGYHLTNQAPPARPGGNCGRRTHQPYSPVRRAAGATRSACSRKTKVSLSQVTSRACAEVVVERLLFGNRHRLLVDCCSPDSRGLIFVNMETL